MQSKEEILELYGIETSYTYNPLMENIKKAMEQYASQFQSPQDVEAKEAAEKYYWDGKNNDDHADVPHIVIQNAFIAGAKWGKLSDNDNKKQ